MTRKVTVKQGGSTRYLLVKNNKIIAASQKARTLLQHKKASDYIDQRAREMK